MQDYADPELSLMASQVAKLYPNFLNTPELIPTLFRYFLNVCTEPELQKTWHIKTRILPILQVLYFRHLHLLASGVKAAVISCLASLIQDQQLEVRKLAGITLSGIIRCSERDAIETLKVQFTELLKKSDLPKRTRTEQKTAEYLASLVNRHAAVLGLSALILAFPYDIPDWMPQVLVVLAGCQTDPSPILVSSI